MVSAFQNVSAHKLKDLSHHIDCDVLVAGDDKNARGIAIALAQAAGLRGIDVGPLVNSVVAESLTSALIWINRTYKIPDAGIRITGLPESTPDTLMRSGDLLLRPLSGVPRIAVGDDIVAVIIAALAHSGEDLRDGDVVVLTQKIVSKAEGRQVDLAAVTPSLAPSSWPLRLAKTRESSNS